MMLLALACNTAKDNVTTGNNLDSLAQDYVRLGLTIGKYDGDFTDAYYGPDSLKPDTVKLPQFPKDSLLAQVAGLQQKLAVFAATGMADSIQARAKWLNSQLTAFARRIRIFSGELAAFDEEAKDLFSVTAPVYSKAYYDSLLLQLGSVLPGNGSVAERFNKMASKFIIPTNKIDTIFKTAIAEARKRTLAHYNLPQGESFTLEYVTGKPWSGYNWYQGNYKSLIQVNTGIPIFIERAIDLACHEGYPGHHVYNMLLEKNLYRDKNMAEISFYPLFSPQSLIAEGSANYGIEMAFPGREQEEYVKTVLAPLAGLDTAGLSAYFAALSIKAKLAYARNEAARGLINNQLNEQQVLQWLTGYLMMPDKVAATYLNFIKKYRSYVINYNYGQDLVKQYIALKGGTEANPAKRWQLFEWLLSNEVIPSELLAQ